MGAAYQGWVGTFPARVFRCSGSNELSLLETTLWQTHRATQLPCCSPASPPQRFINHHLAREGIPRPAHGGLDLHPSAMGAHQGGSITAGGSGMQERQRGCGSTPGAPHRADPSPAPALTGCGATVELRLVPKALVVFPSVGPALAQPQRDQVSDDSQPWPG